MKLRNSTLAAWPDGHPNHTHAYIVRRNPISTISEDANRPDERLLFFAVDLLAKAGRKGDAEAQLWRAFEKAPSLSVYERLRALGGKPRASVR